MKVKKSIVVLFSLIGLFSVAYLIYTNVLPDKSLFKSKINEYEQVSASYEGMSNNFKKLKSYEKTEQELLDDISQLNILNNIYQEEIINILNNMLEACEINPGKITFSEIYTVNINDIYKKEDEIQDAIEEIIEAQAMTVNIELSSKYYNLISFIDEIQKSDTDISITNIKIINHEEGEEVQCQIALNFYALPL